MDYWQWVILAVLAVAPFFSVGTRFHWPMEASGQYLAVATVAVAMLFVSMSPGLGIVMLVVVLHQDLRMIYLFAVTIGGVLVASQTPGLDRSIGPCLVIGASAQVVIAVIQKGSMIWYGVQATHHRREFTRGTFPGPIFYGTFIAIATPFAPWWVIPFLVGGAALSESITIVIATMVGICWVYPIAIFPALVGAAILYGVIQPRRSHPIDSIRSRVSVIRDVLSVWTSMPWIDRLVGMGPQSLDLHLGALRARRGTGQRWMWLHCDGIQFGLEYGLVGLLGIALWGSALVGHMRIGDPMTASVVVALIVSLTQPPFYTPSTAIPILAVAATLAGRA